MFYYWFSINHKSCFIHRRLIIELIGARITLKWQFLAIESLWTLFYTPEVVLSESRAHNTTFSTKNKTLWPCVAYLRLILGKIFFHETVPTRTHFYQPIQTCTKLYHCNKLYWLQRQEFVAVCAISRFLPYTAANRDFSCSPQ